MKIVEVTQRDENFIKQLLAVWEDSVKATHVFLSEAEILEIKQYVPQALQQIAHLIVIEKNSIPVAFMGIEKQKLEMLFIKDSERGKGLGKELLDYGIQRYQINELVVNEQNPNAKGFYEQGESLSYLIYEKK